MGGGDKCRYSVLGMGGCSHPESVISIVSPVGNITFHLKISNLESTVLLIDVNSAVALPLEPEMGKETSTLPCSKLRCPETYGSGPKRKGTGLMSFPSISWRRCDDLSL